jgi:hypothetical protein
MAITAARQRNAVSEGMTLGLPMCGRNSLPFDKVSIELSFEGAWRFWQYRRTFPQVDTDVRQGLDGVWAMTRADERKQPFNLFWHTDAPEVTICGRGVWSDEDVDADQASAWIDGGVPAEGWRDLATDFLGRFDR